MKESINNFISFYKKAEKEKIRSGSTKVDLNIDESPKYIEAFLSTPIVMSKIHIVPEVGNDKKERSTPISVKIK